MPVNRFFLSKTLEQGEQLRLIDQEFHHLANVVRLEEGESAEIVNGKGVLAEAIVKKVGKKEAILEIAKVVSESKQDFEVILAQAVPRLNRLDFILEKGTELGMTQLWLFPGVHSERKKLQEEQLKRMEAVTVSAMKQCGRLFLPTIKLKPELEQWEKNDQYFSLFGDLSDQAMFLDRAWEKNRGQKAGVLVFIGPESGFAPSEVLRLHQLNAVGIRLHQNILRTDTAALVALSLINQEMMRD